MTTRHALAAAVAIAGLAIAVPAARQARDQQALKTGTAGLSGVVLTDETTPRPIRRAQVSIINTELTLNRTTFTDESGRFSITGLPAGRYTLAATKPAHLRVSYGARRPDRPGTPITLQDGHQMTDITLRMSRGAVLGGTITDENGQPAFGVNVRVMQLRIQNGERTFVSVPAGGPLGETTDDRGTFRFYGLPAGEYAISATPRLIPGEIRAMTDSEIRAVMQALQQQKVAAQQTAQNPAVANVYATQQAAQPTPNEDVVTVGYASVYYPGTTVAASAGTVTVVAGEERLGVDFALRLVRTAKVSGTVATPPGIPPQSVQLMLTPSSPVPGAAGIELGSMTRVSPGPDGSFTFDAVPPGDYTISARATAGQGQAGGGGRGGGPVTMQFQAMRVSPPGGSAEPVMVMPEFTSESSGSPYWGQTDITVDGTAISGLAISLQPGMTITGKLAFRATRLVPEGDLSRVRLTLAPAPAQGGPRITMGVPTAQVMPDGQFTISGVTPGRYRLAAAAPVPTGSGPGSRWTLLSAIVKGRDVLDFPLEIGPNDEISDVVVTFTDSTQDISGSLQDATGRPAPDYTIVVFADDSRYWTQPSRRIRSTRPGTDGRFSIGNLPPGEYRIAAVVDLAPGETNDPSFLEQLVPASVKFSLAEGEKKAQDLKISGGL